MRFGRRLGIDVGRARVGVAQSDPHGMLATPVATLKRDAATVAAVVSQARELEVIEIVVGLPLSLSGADTASTQDAREFAASLAAAAAIPVRLVDERMSTVSAQAALRASGRRSRSSRSVIDQAAAVVILQHALDAESAGSVAPGTIVTTE